MSAETDLQTGLPVGVPVNPSPARRPERVTFSGRLVDLVPLDAASHTEALADGACGTEHAPLWPYLADGPFDDRAQFRALMENKSTATDAVFFAIVIYFILYYNLIPYICIHKPLYFNFRYSILSISLLQV